MAENIYNVAVKIAARDVECTLDGGCVEKHSADGPLAASTATSAALLATTCVWIWLIGLVTFSQEAVIVGSTYTSQKNKKKQKKQTKSNVCTLRAPARLKGTLKENPEIKWASIESSRSKVDKTRRRNSAFFGSGIGGIQQMGRLVVWWGVSFLKCSAFKSQLKDFCFCRRRPDLAAQLRGKQRGCTLMFSWKFSLPDLHPKGSRWAVLLAFFVKLSNKGI